MDDKSLDLLLIFKVSSSVILHLWSVKQTMNGILSSTSLYSLSVLRVSVAERDSVVRIVTPEEKPRKAAKQNRDYRNTKIHQLINQLKKNW